MICTTERKAYIPVWLQFSMGDVDLEAGLRSLQESLRQIKTLLAWQQLKQAEAKPGQPPGLTDRRPHVPIN
jgi:hypothetical protein